MQFSQKQNLDVCEPDCVRLLSSTEEEKDELLRGENGDSVSNEEAVVSSEDLLCRAVYNQDTVACQNIHSEFRHARLPQI